MNEYRYEWKPRWCPGIRGGLSCVELWAHELSSPNNMTHYSQYIVNSIYLDSIRPVDNPRLGRLWRLGDLVLKDLDRLKRVALIKAKLRT